MKIIGSMSSTSFLCEVSADEIARISQTNTDHFLKKQNFEGA